MGKFSKTNMNNLKAQCQNCYRHGHWTYECKNPKVYLVRPSHTAILKNSKLKPRINDDEVIPEIPRITDGDYNRDPYYKRISEKSKLAKDNRTNDKSKYLEYIFRQTSKTYRNNGATSSISSSNSSSSSSSGSSSSSSSSSASNSSTDPSSSKDSGSNTSRSSSSSYSSHTQSSSSRSSRSSSQSPLI